MTKRAEKTGARVVADALRADEPVLDPLARARLEKRVVEAAGAGGLGSDKTGSDKTGSDKTGADRTGADRTGAGGVLQGRRLAVGVGVVVLAAAAALLLVTRGGGLPNERGPGPLADATSGAAPGTATFEAMGGEQPVRRGALPEGEAVETRAGQRVRVHFAQSRVEVAPETRARFAKLRPEDVRIALETGRVDVAFHPLHRGAEHLTIETPSARVEVVGTEFTVELDAAGATTVRVSEGIVRVVPLDGSATRLVRAGTQTRVPVSLAAARSAQTDAVALADEPAAPQPAAGQPLGPQPAAGQPLGPQPAAGQPLTAEAVHAGAVAHPHVGAEPTVTAEPAEPLTGAARFAAASGLYHRGQLEEAAEALLPLTHDAHLQAAVRRDAANLLGDIYKGWRRLDDAASEYDRACGLGSDESCYSLGGVAENLDQNDRARVAYRAYLHRAPDGALALQARARLCRPLGVSEACYGSVITPYTP